MQQPSLFDYLPTKPQPASEAKASLLDLIGGGDHAETLGEFRTDRPPQHGPLAEPPPEAWKILDEAGQLWAVGECSCSDAEMLKHFGPDWREHAGSNYFDYQDEEDTARVLVICRHCSRKV